ncbi:glucuronyl esterase domain-containing protein [Halosimplex salinum]|uniref:glucuronyl esterase domain-containing protein n=1 Tax=Halosimplex salinum TaxID=1710538 RepID=UPI000F489EBE|nr:acetylxylan esterase [Halosimplex salinum]
MDEDAPRALPAVSRLEPRDELPDPLEPLDGDRVRTAEDWRERRRELRRLLRHYVYGYAPEAPDIETETERTAGVLDGAATLVETEIGFPDLPADAPSITLALYLPTEVADADESAPVLLGLNWGGNHAAVADEAVTITDRAREYGADERGVASDYWCVDRVLSRGYGFATYHLADVDPDNPDRADGIRPYFDDELPGPPGTEWGSLAAWAWGLQRCVDALRERDGVRSDEIAVTGHSRCGKAALLAGATDERIGLVAPHQSGTGGTALSRDNGQESVGDITGTFPHWFADTFSAFHGQVDRLPVDAHCLAALVAPRPLIDTEGARDYWANPGRALDALRAAEPVWELLGEDGAADDLPLHEGDEMSEETVGAVCQFRRETEHTLDAGYVDAILDFADVHFDRA